jgi:heme/copper-type cytochrome/quinol oxidase subunit 2
LALMVAAPVAEGVHVLAAATRVKSSVATAGTLNPAVSVAEDALSVGGILLALLVPVMALVLTLVAVVVIWRMVKRRRGRGRREEGGVGVG